MYFYLLVILLFYNNSVIAKNLCYNIFNKPEDRILFQLKPKNILIDLNKNANSEARVEIIKFSSPYGGKTNLRNRRDFFPLEYLIFQQRPKEEIQSDGIPLTTILSDYPNLPHPLKKSPEVTVTSKEMSDYIQSALESLYQSYLIQGAERSQNLTAYRNEDIINAARTTHFMISAREEALTHIQAQWSRYSRRDEELLNVERHFPQSRDFIRPHNEEIVIEIGRFEILKSNQLNDLDNKKIVSTQKGRNLLFADTWLQLTQWLLKNAPDVPVVFQVNNSVLKITMKQFSPLELTDKLQVQLKPNLPTEWIIRLNADQLRDLRRIVFLKKLKINLETFLTSNHTELTLTVTPEERDLYTHIGAYQLSEFYATWEQTLFYGINVMEPVKFREENLQKRHILKFGRNQIEKLLHQINEDKV